MPTLLKVLTTRTLVLYIAMFMIIFFNLSEWNYGMWYFRELHMGYGGYREGRNACKEGERARTQSRRTIT